jgi:hypothetical protein
MITESETRLSNFGIAFSVRGGLVDKRPKQHLPPLSSVLRPGDEGRVVMDADCTMHREHSCKLH